MRMSRRFRIPISVVERLSRRINFLMSIDIFHMEEIESSLVWIFELDYEILEDEVDNFAKILFESPKNLNIKGTSNSATRTGKKRKSVVKQEVAEGSELEHEHENIQRDLEEL